MKVNLLVLRTSRIEEMRTFYSALGARFEREQHGKGPEHYAATLGGEFVLELYPCVDGATPDTALRLGVTVDNINETVNRIGQSVALRQTQWGVCALVRDPDGRAVELTQSCAGVTSAA